MRRFKHAVARRVPWLAKLWRSLVATRMRSRTAEDIFSGIHRQNAWGDRTSRSGVGSNLVQTEHVRKLLPLLLNSYGCTSLLDAPCGDFLWLSEVDLPIDYTGCDVVEELVRANQQRFGREGRHFIQADLLKDPLPQADTVLCRDCLVHFSFEDALRALANIKASGSKYLLTTTFTGRAANYEIPTGLWRPLNLELAPFNFPKPIELMNERCTELNGEFSDKALGLWQLSELLPNQEH